MKTNNIGIKLIKYFESLHDGDLTKIGLQPKMCPAGIWTIGYGHALKDINGKWLKGEEGFKRLLEIYPDYETITEKEADEILLEDLNKFEKIVLSKVKVSLNQNQFDALVSHTFNTGGSNTLFKLINNHESEDIIKNWWTTKYITANGKPLKGLQKRRLIEWELFSTGKLTI